MTTQVHYPMEAIQNVPFSDSKVQLLEAQVGFRLFLSLWHAVSWWYITSMACPFFSGCIIQTEFHPYCFTFLSIKKKKKKDPIFFYKYLRSEIEFVLSITSIGAHRRLNSIKFTLSTNLVCACRRLNWGVYYLEVCWIMAFFQKAQKKVRVMIWGREESAIIVGVVSARCPLT